MTDQLNLDGIPEDELGRFLAFRGKVAGTNISETTLLATDYLNHFNEIIMLLEMVPDMPDILEECKAWAPKSYADHFHDSTFRDKELAVEAYGAVPTKFRQPFEDTIGQMDRLVPMSIGHLEQILATGDMDLLRIKAQACSRGLQRLMDVASGIIHGSAITMEQDQIDDLMGF
ncbi:MAG: hypothetical protein A2516_10695 [Alphaproteobacteria bacterium RIFOXYD12_FULL_60_8]|nr:MAG: hypothetical protein A2516_10695 [Alphaproteobacteria bacterium RIFOXYD12_FULL_60_8]